MSDIWARDMSLSYPHEFRLTGNRRLRLHKVWWHSSPIPIMQVEVEAEIIDENHSTFVRIGTFWRDARIEDAEPSGGDSAEKPGVAPDIERAALRDIGLSAPLPPHYRYGKDALDHVDTGRRLATAAILKALDGEAADDDLDRKIAANKDALELADKCMLQARAGAQSTACSQLLDDASETIRKLVVA